MCLYFHCIDRIIMKWHLHYWYCPPYLRFTEVNFKFTLSTEVYPFYSNHLFVCFKITKIFAKYVEY